MKVKTGPSKTGAAAQKNKTATKTMTTPKSPEEIMIMSEDHKTKLPPASQTAKKRVHNENLGFDGEEPPTKTVKREVKEEHHQ